MFSFTGFATRADEHKDGFGIAFFEDKGVRLFVDSAQRAASRRWPRSCGAFPIKQREHRRPHPQGDAGPRRARENASVRARTVGPLLGVRPQRRPEELRSRACTAPFVRWATTDSERAFCWLMQELAKAHASVPGDRRAERDAGASCCREVASPRRLQRHALATARRSGRIARHSCFHIVRQHPFHARVAAGRRRHRRFRRAHFSRATASPSSSPSR